MGFAMFLMGIGHLIFVAGAFGMFGLFIYGIYYALFQSIQVGLMLIGASMVGTFIFRLVSWLLMAGGAKLVAVAADREMEG